jgi:hypothetical protein
MPARVFIMPILRPMSSMPPSCPSAEPINAIQAPEQNLRIFVQQLKILFHFFSDGEEKSYPYKMEMPVMLATVRQNGHAIVETPVSAVITVMMFIAPASNKIIE